MQKSNLLKPKISLPNCSAKALRKEAKKMVKEAKKEVKIWEKFFSR